jgi:biopolymer transport protein ExbD
MRRDSRRLPIDLQLTPLVDVFSMLVIFMILGSVMGGADMTFSDTFTPPKSFSRELSETAPTLVVSKNGVEAGFAKVDAKLSDFMGDDTRSNNTRHLFQTQLSTWRDGLPQEVKDLGAPINIAAHEHLSYRELFEVLKVVRAAGFETLMFVALAEPRTPQ